MAKYKDKMLIDMQLKGFAKTTQEAYLKCMYNFIKFHKIPPDKITIDNSVKSIFDLFIQINSHIDIIWRDSS